MTSDKEQEIKIYKLRKSEIIRGYDAYNKIIQNSKYFNTDLLKAYLNYKQTDSNIGLLNDNKLSKSPLSYSNLKVGFIVSKREIPKANKRNKLKRLLKESYRLNKFFF